MIKTDDNALWENLKQSVLPFKSGRKKEDIPPRLRVHRAPVKPVSYTLDLHQMTLEEAYNISHKFIQRHYKLGSKKIQIITGKGHMGGGAIRGEFGGWLDTPKFKQYIRETEWTNDKGAMNIWLRKNK